MPRKKLAYVANGIYHVTARSNNKEWFYVPNNKLWKIFEEQFQEISILYHAHIVAFVLMSNHYHLLIETPEANLGLMMNYLQREVSRSVGSISGRINHVFGGTYKGTLIEHETYLYNVYRYIYQNPVVANICEKVEQYQFSTLSYLTDGKSPFPLADNIAIERAPIPQSLSDKINWLNLILSADQISLINRGLKGPVFKFPKKFGYRHIINSLRYDAPCSYGK